MTSKLTKSDPLSAGGAQSAATRKPRRTGAMHSKPSTPVATSPSSSPVDAEAIARLAYSYWEARGYAPGSPEEDWFRAEQELMQ